MTFPPTMNIMAIVSNVATAYNIPIHNPGQLRRVQLISRQTLDVAYGAADYFRAAINGQFHLFLNFLRSLDQGGGAAAKLAALRHINTAFSAQNTILPIPPMLARWAAFGVACAAVPPPARPPLANFYQTRNQNSALTDIEGIFNTANAAGHGPQALEIVKLTMEQNGNAAGITTQAILALINMSLAHRPMSGFMGFTQWGPGDAIDMLPVTNLRNHVMKHVCRDPVDVEFGVSETIKAWDRLNIRLTIQAYDAHAAPAVLAVRNCFNGNLPLSGDRLKRFLVLHGLQNQAALKQHICGLASDAYRDFAIESSRVMTNVIVQSNGVKVFISGSAGDAFIIGRFEGGQLGISSCYWPMDIQTKLAGAASNKVWQLRN